MSATKKPNVIKGDFSPKESFSPAAEERFETLVRRLDVVRMLVIGATAGVALAYLALKPRKEDSENG